ncbi:hypothetical protein GDO81_013926 [Engystomops pustulosus]|uniref:Uncharacterized protein n=1 Tax=Engystomops pustulosus TaxID=76066 RepID=A0AAV7B6Q0_ENGPU|nr:hypothetical protein GDO81_013926 [Engystomops pustulosus]
MIPLMMLFCMQRHESGLYSHQPPTTHSLHHLQFIPQKSSFKEEMIFFPSQMILSLKNAWEIQCFYTGAYPPIISGARRYLVIYCRIC